MRQISDFNYFFLSVMSGCLEFSQPQEEHTPPAEPMDVIDEAILDEEDPASDDSLPPVHQQQNPPHIMIVPEDQNQLDNLCQAVNSCELNGQQVVPRRQIQRYVVVLADFSVGKAKFMYAGMEIRWVLQINPSLIETTAQIGRFCDEQTPKTLIIQCLSQYLDTFSISEIRDHIKMITAKAERNPEHQLVVCSMPFKPIHECYWMAVSELNSFIRLSNLSLHQSPLSLHKASLTKVPKLQALAVNGRMWAEKVNGSGLGSTLSSVGIRKHETWICRHAVLGMQPGQEVLAAPDTENVIPARLQDTPGYKTPKFTEMLKTLGTYVPRPVQEHPQRFGQNNQHNQCRQQRTNKNKGAVVKNNQDLRPKLQSIQKRRSSNVSMARSSTSSFDSGIHSVACSSSVESAAGGCHAQDRINKLEDQLEKLKVDSRSREESHMRRLDYLNSELEYVGHHRRSAEARCLQLEDDNQLIRDNNSRLRGYREDAEDLRDELRSLKNKNKDRK